MRTKAKESIVNLIMEEMNCYNPKRVIAPVEIDDRRFILLEHKIRTILKDYIIIKKFGGKKW